MKSIGFIGTGSAFNHIHGNNTAILEFNDTNLLIDCGHTFCSQLEKARITTDEIKNIFITHVHGDHIGGLEELAFRNRYLHDGFKPRLYIPAGIHNRLRSYLEATLKFTAEGICELEDYFDVYVVHEKFILNDYVFTVEKTEHIPIAKSYMLIGENFIFTGDTKFIDWTKWDLSGIDFIFQDTQLSKYGDDVHATLPDLITLPKEIKEKIYCMHYGEYIDNLIFKNQILTNGMHIVSPYDTFILEK